MPVHYKLEGDKSKQAQVEKITLRDTVVTFNPDTYEEKMKVIESTAEQVVVVGYSDNSQKQEILNEFNAILKGHSNMSEEQKQQALKDFAATAKKYADKYPEDKEETMKILMEVLKQNGLTAAPSSASGVQVQGTEIFKVVEEMPRFPGCEDMAGETDEKKACADKKMLEFVYQNIRYPKEAREKGIEGMAVVSFIVGKDGVIREPKIVRGIGGGCDEEVLRMANLMPQWIPGKQRGRVVDVQFNLPVRFKLGEEEKLAAKNLPNADLPANTLQLQNFKASPNPTNGVLNLSFKGEKKPTVVKVFDLQGKEVQSLELKNFDGTFNERLDLSKAGKGVLIISVLQGEQSYTEKVIVQ